MSKIAILICIFWSLNSLAGESSRQTAKGYFHLDNKGRIFFIQRPGILEPGIQVLFESAKTEKRICKLRKPLPIECPVQEISFVPSLKNGEKTMTKVRLVKATSTWHRLHATEEIFGIPPK